MSFLRHEHKARIVKLRSKGKGHSEIVRLLAKDDVKVSQWSVIKFLQRYQERQSLENAPKKGRPSEVVTIEVKNFIYAEMERNDEMTSPLLARRIYEEFGLRFSIPKVNNWERNFAGFRPVPNTASWSESRIEWTGWRLARSAYQTMNSFNDVIFTDECSVQMENHSKITFHHIWEQPRLKGRPKHPVKVHIWAGISKPGPTTLMIFEGIMDAQFFVTEIMTNRLLPLVRETFSDGYRFQQDNDPKHTSRLARSFFEENNINWWIMPAESPDLNPIELLWLWKNISCLHAGFDLDFLKACFPFLSHLVENELLASRDFVTHYRDFIAHLSTCSKSSFDCVQHSRVQPTWAI